eukprot:TRINITY_DN2312_c0_g1_i1.p1 TRINITY_DN2312_c0_g1~~TRINITY_DN2312_c0_g1_i1.p1  ORF type:complete len:391 (-),score=114.42 TRINITY_DN2312_c0_g1_i1:110-1282(-)
MSTSSSPLMFLEAQQAAHPDLSRWYAEMADLYQRKLWHQLTVKLEQFVAMAVLQAGDTLIQLYHNFISDFETKINLLKLAHLAVIISRQYPERESAIAYLENVIEKLRATKERRKEEPVLYVQMQIAALKLQGGDEKDCKKLLEEGKVVMEEMTDIDATVHASIHWVSSQYFKSRQEYAEFYKSALLYLGFTSVDGLAESFKLDLAVDLSLAALLGEDVYNFGELLAHPIVNALKGSSFEWLLHVLEAFESGSLQKYDELCVKYAADLNAQPALVENERRLREKITILCLMDVIFSRPSDERTIPLTVISERTKLPVEGVEMLLMKTLSVHLIEGVIDQVSGTVRVSWVKPRVLSLPQVAALKDRLDTWLSKVHTTLLAVEAEAPDLLSG